MKGLKLSKTSWLILSAGVFVVVLAGLGLTRSQQLKEQTELDEALAITNARLSKLELTGLQQEQAELQQRLDEGKSELEEVKNRLRQTVESVEVTDEFFQIAEYSNVDIISYSNSMMSAGSLGSVGCMTTMINASIEGYTSDLIDFVINLNQGFTTGIVRNVSISIPDEEDENKSTSSISVTVYSYEGT